MRLIVSLSWEKGGLYAPHCPSFIGRKEGSMRLIVPLLVPQGGYIPPGVHLREAIYHPGTP